jgi:hypothetical protein
VLNCHERSILPDEKERLDPERVRVVNERCVRAMTRGKADSYTSADMPRESTVMHSIKYKLLMYLLVPF